MPNSEGEITRHGAIDRCAVSVIPAQPIDESFLNSLGVHRFEVPLPFIEAGGPANVYAIENDDSTWSLFDTGLSTPDALAALNAQASEHGVDLQRVSRIIVSHGHPDHYGNAQYFAEQTGAPIFIHPADLEKICGEGRWFIELERHRHYYLKLGVPAALLQTMIDRNRDGVSGTRQVDRERVHLLHGGQTLHFKRFDAQVLHLPGHTPGLICLHAPTQRMLFADDHVLARISPNPLLDLSQGEGPTKFLALVRYLEGAKAVQALELDCVLPGHGPAFRNHRELLDELFEMYRKRQDKLLTALRVKPASPYRLIDSIFARRNDRRLHLMLSETLGNLEVMERDGRVKRTETDAVFEFRAG